MTPALRQSTIVETLRKYFEREALRFGVEAAFLFGSWAAGLPRFRSDVDVAVLFENKDISENEVFKLLNVIMFSLAKILFCEVNAIPIYTDFRKPMLYYNAIIKGIPVFFKDDLKYIRLINEALYHMEDFEIFGRQWQIDYARRNLEEIQHA
jgi:predicted nucleotidyltransferase